MKLNLLARLGAASFPTSLARLGTAVGKVPLRIAGVAAALVVMQGCTAVYKTTGDILVNFGRGEMTPYLLKYEDIGMACATGEGFTPFLMSFEAVGSKPARLGTLVNTMAALCSDQVAWEQDLRYLREMRQGNVAEAQDARALQKRFARVSAMRQYEAYQRMVGYYGEVEDVQRDCPRLRSDFDEVVYMSGLLSGVQALLNDSVADVSLGVPRDLAAKIERASQCLDNDKWWGVPLGVRAALWNTLPMIAPDGVDAKATLKAAAEQGVASGVRLASVMYAVSTYGTGDMDLVRDAIRSFVTVEPEVLDQDYRMLDAIAELMITTLSDRMWTEATGKRTPFGGLGTFWDDTQTSRDVNIDDLL